MGSSAQKQLLHRAEDEVWLQCLFEFHTGSPVAEDADDDARGRRATARFSGMFELFREHPAFIALCDLPSGAEFGRGCAAFLDSQPMDALGPAAHHALALYFAEVAEAITRGRTNDAGIEAASRYLGRSLAHWLRLRAEGDYLRSWASRMLEPGADPAAIMEAFFERIVRKLELEVRRGVAQPDPRALSILRALSPRERERVWHDAALPHDAEPSFRLFMASAFETLVHELIQSFLREMEEAKARGDDATLRSERVMTAGLRLWEASQRAVEAEVLVLEHAEQVGWDLRRGKHWKPLARLYSMLDKLVLGLAERVERDPDQFAFAARAAQALTFLADARESLDARIELTERGLRLCPGHPMAKTMLSFYLASRGLQILRAAGAKPGAVAVEARALYERAKELDPKDEAVKQLGLLLSDLRL